jgi:hypothetical protein
MTISRIVDKPISKSLEAIAYEEANHFTKSRIKSISITFLILFCTLFLISTNLVSNNYDANKMIKLAAFLMFVAYCIWATIQSSK